MWKIFGLSEIFSRMQGSGHRKPVNILLLSYKALILLIKTRTRYNTKTKWYFIYFKFFIIPKTNHGGLHDNSNFKNFYEVMFKKYFWKKIDCRKKKRLLERKKDCKIYDTFFKHYLIEIFKFELSCNRGVTFCF